MPCAAAEPAAAEPASGSTCPVCGGPGAFAYEGLHDRLFGAPGAWSLRGCARAGCGMLWLDPAPDAATLEAAYANYYTHDDTGPGAPDRSFAARLFHAAARGHLANRLGYRDGTTAWQRVLGRGLSLLPARREGVEFSACYLPRPKPGARLLEVGCGSGGMLERMAGLGWNVSGVDLDQDAAERARARGLDVRAGELVDVAHPDRSFDAIVLVHVIEHVSDPLALLRECRRIAAPGARLVVITPNVRSRGHARFGRCWRGLEPPRHLQLFSRDALATLCQRAGFGRVDVRATIRDADGIYRRSRAIAERRPDAATASGHRLWSRWQQVLDWLAGWFDGDAGPEIVLRAVAPPSHGDADPSGYGGAV